MGRADDLSQLRSEIETFHAERVEFVNQIAKAEKQKQVAERQVIAERKRELKRRAGNVKEMLAGFRAENEAAHRAWHGRGA